VGARIGVAAHAAVLARSHLHRPPRGVSDERRPACRRRGAAPDRVDLDESAEESQDLELEMYLRVWRVLYPDADVELAAS